MFRRKSNPVVVVPTISAQDALQNHLNNIETGKFQVDQVRNSGGGTANPAYISDGNGYDVGLTFGQVTREALPKMDNYKDLLSVHNLRPTLDELHLNGTIREKVKMKEIDHFI